MRTLSAHIVLLACLGCTLDYRDYDAAEAAPPTSLRGVTDYLVTTPVDEVDLLLVVDNSPSMADKHDLLQSALPELVGDLLLPPCTDVNGLVVARTEGRELP